MARGGCAMTEEMLLEILPERAARELAMLGSLGKSNSYFASRVKHNLFDLLYHLRSQIHPPGALALEIQILYTLFRGAPLSALTEADDEWSDVRRDGTRTNLRCSWVIMQPDGVVRDTHRGIDVKLPYLPPLSKLPGGSC